MIKNKAINAIINHLEILKRECEAKEQSSNKDNFFLGQSVGLDKAIEVLINNADKVDEEINKKTEEYEALVKSNKLVPKTPLITLEEIEEIKELREEGLTYSQIANKTNWSKATISRIINGKYKYSGGQHA